jgi:hypothetical protein
MERHINSEDGVNIFLRNLGYAHKTTRCHNLEHPSLNKYQLKITELTPVSTILCMQYDITNANNFITIYCYP